MDRRNFLKLIGVGSGTALAAGCGDGGSQKLIPYVIPPEEEFTPGRSLYYHTTCLECPSQCGVTAAVREKLDGTTYKRYPIKLEGNVNHPGNEGALCIRGQASLTRLYGSAWGAENMKGFEFTNNGAPSIRTTEPMVRQSDGTVKAVSWDEVMDLIRNQIAMANTQKKKNYYFSGRTTGTMNTVIDKFCGTNTFERLPEFELYSHDSIRMANETLFGRKEIPGYEIDKSDYLLTIGADILDTFVRPVDYTRMLTKARAGGHFQWTHVEPHVSLTGMKADHRETIQARSEHYLLAYLVKTLSKKHGSNLPSSVKALLPSVQEADVVAATGIDKAVLHEMVERLSRAKHPLVIAGGMSTAHESGADVALLAGVLQSMLGMIGSTVNFDYAEDYAHVGSLADFHASITKWGAKDTGVVFISRTNPASFATLKKNGFWVGFSDSLTTTLERCDVILPTTHPLESWGDAVSRKHIRSIVQPVLEPLNNSRSEGDILLDLSTAKIAKTPHTQYRDFLVSLLGSAIDGDLRQKGFIMNTVSPSMVTLDRVKAGAALKAITWVKASSTDVMMITPSVRGFDGRSRDIALMKEIPDPLTTITYGTWVSMSKAHAAKNDMSNRDELNVQAGGMTVIAPTMIQAGLPDDVLTIQIDQLTDSLPMKANGAGEWIAYLNAPKASKTGKQINMAIMSGVLAQKKEITDWPKHGEPKGHRDGKNGMYPVHDHKQTGYQWEMSINMDACTGCSACVAACYVENNIPVVGEKNHLQGREMSWIRIEPEYKGNGKTEHQPMMCQQCENAPCEPVCPVLATVHNEDGLNAQVYNRCVGTRYCSNNCPYKVRRFNWFDYAPVGDMMKMVNPDVSLRDRGIMEKCTFCVQRIKTVKDEAKNENRRVRDGEVVPACAQTCPADAIVFGNLLDKESKVYKLAQEKNATRSHEDLGTEPSVHYLKEKNEHHG